MAKLTKAQAAGTVTNPMLREIVKDVVGSEGNPATIAQRLLTTKPQLAQQLQQAEVVFAQMTAQERKVFTTGGGHDDPYPVREQLAAKYGAAGVAAHEALECFYDLLMGEEN